MGTAKPEWGEEMRSKEISEIVQDLREGRFVIIVDDEDRENEGDLAVAAQFATAEAINFMATEARGLICLSMTGDRLDELGLPLMVPENTSYLSTAFTVSVDAKRGTTTGISAQDRAATIAAMIDPGTKAEDLARPGHLFPLRCAEGGVMSRQGQTEAVVELAKIGQLYPAGVICEIMNPDGTMARRPQLETFAERHNFGIISVASIREYRLSQERAVQPVG